MILLLLGLKCLGLMCNYPTNPELLRRLISFFTYYVVLDFDSDEFFFNIFLYMDMVIQSYK
jgi:hypothetical protein